MRGDIGAGLGAGGVVFIAAGGQADDGSDSGGIRWRVGAAAADDRVAAGGGAIQGNGFCALRSAGRDGFSRAGAFCFDAVLSPTGFANGALQDFEDGDE